jgi:hypothetical protein
MNLGTGVFIEKNLPDRAGERKSGKWEARDDVKAIWQEWAAFVVSLLRGSRMPLVHTGN